MKFSQKDQARRMEAKPKWHNMNGDDEEGTLAWLLLTILSIVALALLLVWVRG